MRIFKPEDLKPGAVIPIRAYVTINDYGMLVIINSELPGYLTLGVIELDFVIPDDFNPVAKLVEDIDKQLKGMAEKHMQETSKLREKKAQLLRINYQGSDVLDAAAPTQESP